MGTTPLMVKVGNNKKNNLENLNLLDDEKDVQLQAETKVTVNKGEKKNSDNDEEKSSMASRYGFFCFPSYWKPYFDVESDIILERVRAAALPIFDNLGEHVDGRPDLYGPVWTLITLCFSLTALGQFSTYIQRGWSRSKSFDFTTFEKSVGVCFGTWLVAPATLIIALCFFGVRPGKEKILEMYCIYGYNYILFIFASIAALFPLEVF